MSEKIRVLHISTAKGWRGGEQQIANLLVQSNATPWLENHVLCVANKPFAAFCEQEGIPHTTYKKRSSLSMPTASLLTKYCKLNHIDLIHTHDSHGHSMAILAADVFFNKPKIVLHRRVAFSNKGMSSAYKYNHSKIDQIIAISNQAGDILKQTVSPKNQHKIQVIYSGVNLQKIDQTERVDIRKKLDLPADTLLVGNISALSKNKDYPTFLNVAARLKQTYEKLHFIILGEGPKRADLEALAKELNLTDSVHFLGFQENAIGYLKDFDVFLMPSKLEGLGTAVLEAFACHVPVVGTEAGGMRETIKHEITGLIAPVGDVQMLTTQVEKLLVDQPLRAAIVHNARRLVEQKFSMQQMTEQILAVYQKMMAQ